MALVDYSGSEDSDQEISQPVPPPPLKSKTNPNKPAFQKLVDPSNPNKIKVVLPDTKDISTSDELDGSEPAAKRAKTGPSSFSGFNSFLPAPKKAAASSGANSNGPSKGLGKGVSLKTGAAPGFNREPNPIPSEEQPVENGSKRADTLEAQESGSNLGTELAQGTENLARAEIDDQPKKKATIFKPLSVARKPQKRKIAGNDVQNGAPATSKGPSAQAPSAPRVSLFSVSDTSETSNEPLSTSGPYQSMLYQKEEFQPDPAPEALDPTYAPSFSQDTSINTVPQSPYQDPNSLTSIASDLNLSASAKRQLLGRHNAKSHSAAAPINIVNFNTDEEYAANEVLRQAGETVQHNPVRAIAPGKHSLKQLVNAATNQKEALEEHFAAGRRNKSEAGAKYGW